MFKVNDQVICTSKTIKSLTYDRVYTVRWVSGSQILVNNDTGCGYYYSKEHFKKMEKDMENVRVGDIVRCINNKNSYYELTLNGKYEVTRIVGGEFLQVIDDEGLRAELLKSRFEVVPPIPKFTGNMYKGGRIPEIKLPKIYLGENEIDYGMSEFPDIQVDIEKLNKEVMSFMDSLGIFKKGE